MGAELLIAACPIPHYVGSGDYIKAPTPDLTRQLTERLQSAPEIERFIENSLYVEDDENPIEVAVNAVNAFLAVWINSREVATIETDRLPLIVTGGPSWGDDPTECFSIVAFIQATGLFDEPFDDDEDEWSEWEREKSMREQLGDPDDRNLG